MFHTKLFPEKAKYEHLYLAKYEKEYVIKLATKQEYASTIVSSKYFIPKIFKDFAEAMHRGSGYST